MYAAAGSQCDGSTLLMEPHAAAPDRLRPADTLDHVFAVSRVTETTPSLLPVHMMPRRMRDSLIERSVPPYSTPMLSPVRPPEYCCFDLSLRVRSGEISFHVRPPSVDWCTYW